MVGSVERLRANESWPVYRHGFSCNRLDVDLDIVDYEIAYVELRLSARNRLPRSRLGTCILELEGLQHLLPYQPHLCGREERGCHL